MAEPQKDAPSPLNPKFKSSMFDLDIGKDFLSSWKSMSMSEDDPMDFDFGSIGKGKKAFNFNKSDMDFTFGSDFNKLSSFKVDMSDLDIASPIKSTHKLKERSEEESASGCRQGRTDPFTFSFDFNELDKFTFESNLKNKEKKSKKTQDGEDLKKTKGQGFGANMTDVASNGTSEDGTTLKLPALADMAASESSTQGGSLADFDPKSENHSLELAMKDKSPLKSIASETTLALQGARPSEEITSTTSTQVANRESQHPEMITSPSSYAEKNKQDLRVPSVLSVSGNGLTQDAAAELQEEVTSSDSKLNTSSGEGPNVNDKAPVDSGVSCDNSMLEDFVPINVANQQTENDARSKFGGESNVPTDSASGAESAEADSCCRDNSDTSISRNLMHDPDRNGQNQNPTLSSEEPVVRSKYFRKLDKTDSELQQAKPTQAKLEPFGSNQLGTTSLSSPNGRRMHVNTVDGLTGIKLGGISRSCSKESSKSDILQIGNLESIKCLKGSGEGSTAASTQKGSQLMGNARPSNQDIAKSKTITRASGNNVENHDTSSLNADPSSHSGHANKCPSPTSANNRLLISNLMLIQSLKSISAEGNKTSSLGDGGTPQFSVLKISREGTVEPSNLCSQKRSNTLRKIEHHLHETIDSKVASSVDTKKKTHTTPSLKRKAPEASDTEMQTLNPLKRLSESPSEKKNLREPTKTAVDHWLPSETVEVHKSENLAGSNKISPNGCRSPTLDNSVQVSMTDFKIASVTEFDSNVEKAEACTKELEDICNMLKRKHEEAKELLVRSVVNNNNLLMLNHPIYEEKILVIQKFANQLMSNGLCT